MPTAIDPALFAEDAERELAAAVDAAVADTDPLLARRDYVAPDDLQAVAAQTIAHRLVPVAGAGRGRVEQVRAMLESVALP